MNAVVKDSFQQGNVNTLAYFDAIKDYKVDRSNLPANYKLYYNGARVVYELVDLGSNVTGFVTTQDGVVTRH